MNMKKNKYIRAFFILLTLILVVFAIYFYEAIVSYFIWAAFFAFIFNPFIVMIENLGVKRVYAILIFYIIFFFNVFLFSSIFFPIIIRQINNFSETYINFVTQPDSSVNNMPYLANLQRIFGEIKALFPFVDFENVGVNIIEKTSDLFTRLPNLLLSYSSNVFKLFSYLASVPIISFFILKDHIFLRNKLFSMIPNKYFEISLLTIDKINTTIGTYLRALLIEISIVTTMNCIVLTVLGIRFGILVGVIAGIFNIIPYLGPLTGIVLAGLTVIFTGGPSNLLVYTMLGMWGVQLVDNAVVYPTVMGKNTKMHPIVIILSVIAGGASFGFFGMMIAVPTLFLVKELVRLLYKNLKQFEII